MPEKRLLLALGTELGCLRRVLLADVDRTANRNALLRDAARASGLAGETAGGAAEPFMEPLAGLASEEARTAVREGRTAAALPQLLREMGTRYAEWAAAAVGAATGRNAAPVPLPLRMRCDELSAVHVEESSATDVEVHLVYEG